MCHLQAGCCFHSRSQTGCPFPERARSWSFTTNPCRTQPSTTANHNTHWQHNNSWNCQQHDQMPKITSNGDVILLVIGWQNTRILHILLPTWPQKPRWLSIQTSYCRHTSTRQTILHPHKKTPPLSCQELRSQAPIEGLLNSLGIPTPRKTHYQALVIFPSSGWLP